MKLIGKHETTIILNHVTKKSTEIYNFSLITFSKIGAICHTSLNSCRFQKYPKDWLKTKLPATKSLWNLPKGSFSLIIVELLLKQATSRSFLLTSKIFYNCLLSGLKNSSALFVLIFCLEFSCLFF